MQSPFPRKKTGTNDCSYLFIIRDFASPSNRIPPRISGIKNILYVSLYPLIYM